MAWNDSGNGKDPWNKGGEAPIDLDKMVQNWQRKLNAMLGGGSKGGKDAGGAWLLPIILLIAWAATGTYKVDEAERGVVQRFGAYTVTTMPGFRWHLPYPIETVDVVNTNEVSRYEYANEILTADEQYVFIQMVVQYRREDPVKFSFEVFDPEGTLEDVTQSALREVLGTSDLDVLVSERREEIVPRTLAVLQDTLDSYGSGIKVSAITLEKLDYPRQVQDAVDDVQKARNDSERTVLEAETYAQALLPRARGTASRILQEAEGYRDRVVAEATGQASRFLALLTEYQKAPRVTRDRLYLDAIEYVYGNATKVILDAEGSGNLLYLPLDKLIDSGGRGAARMDPNSIFNAQTEGAAAASSSETDSARSRRTRQ